MMLGVGMVFAEWSQCPAIGRMKYQEQCVGVVFAEWSQCPAIGRMKYQEQC